MQPWWSFVILAAILTAIFVPTLVVCLSRSSNGPSSGYTVYVIEKANGVAGLPTLIGSNDLTNWTVLGSNDSSIDIQRVLKVGQTVFMTANDSTNNIWQTSSSGVFSPVANTAFSDTGALNIVKSPTSNLIATTTIVINPANTTTLFTTTNGFQNSTTVSTIPDYLGTSLALRNDLYWALQVLDGPQPSYSLPAFSMDGGSTWNIPFPVGPPPTEIYSFVAWSEVLGSFVTCGLDTQSTRGVFALLDKANGAPTPFFNTLTETTCNPLSIISNTDGTIWLVNDGNQNIWWSNDSPSVPFATFEKSFTNGVLDIQWVPSLNKFLLAAFTGLFTSSDGQTWTSVYPWPAELANAWIAA